MGWVRQRRNGCRGRWEDGAGAGFGDGVSKVGV